MMKFDTWLKSMVENMKNYIENKIDAATFDRIFFDLWPKHELTNNQRAEATYYIIHDLFYIVESFCANPQLREKNDIDDKELYQNVIRTLSRLDEFQQSDNIEKVYRESETYQNWSKGGL